MIRCLKRYVISGSYGFSSYLTNESVQGSQYTSLAFGQRCKEAGVRPSMGSAGDCYDNALCESFFATLECELIDRRSFRSRAEAKLAVFSFIEGWSPTGATPRSATCHPSTTSRG